MLLEYIAVYILAFSEWAKHNYVGISPISKRRLLLNIKNKKISVVTNKRIAKISVFEGFYLSCQHTQTPGDL